jgi:NDP-sugar pyrophosphorylase family protein
MQVVITVAGRGLRFSEKGFAEPKPAIRVAGRPAITYLIDSFAKDWKLIFVIGEHFRSSKLEQIVKNYADQKGKDAKVIYTPFSDRGPIDTVLAAMPILNHDEGVVTSYCDLALVWDCAQFEKSVQDYDLAVVNYQGFHPTYFGPNSYCHVQVDTEKKEVLQLQEKKLYTDALEKEVTSAGVYYFKNAGLLSEALNSQLQQDLKYGKEYYISLAVQALLNTSPLRVLDYRIQHLIQLGTPFDIERFQHWYNKRSLTEPFKEFELEKKYWDVIFKKFF